MENQTERNNYKKTFQKGSKKENVANRFCELKTVQKTFSFIY